MKTDTADFASPTAVAAQYLSVWCWMPADGPANQNIANVAAWVTAAGWTDDKSRAIGAETWTEMQAEKIYTVCGPVAAKVTPRPAATDRRRYVELSATRYRVQGSTVIQTDHVQQVRAVLQAADGRWLVDRMEQAG